MAESTDAALPYSRKFTIRAGLRVWSEEPRFAKDVAMIDDLLEGATSAELREIANGSALSGAQIQEMQRKRTARVTADSTLEELRDLATTGFSPEQLREIIATGGLLADLYSRKMKMPKGDLTNDQLDKIVNGGDA
jgi:hypothetical protein